MNYRIISDKELDTIRGGEPITLTLVVAVSVLAIVCVVIFKLYQSYKGKLGLPGGFAIEWQT